MAPRGSSHVLGPPYVRPVLLRCCSVLAFALRTNELLLALLLKVLHADRRRVAGFKGVAGPSPFNIAIGRIASSLSLSTDRTAALVPRAVPRSKHDRYPARFYNVGLGSSVDFSD